MGVFYHGLTWYVLVLVLILGPVIVTICILECIDFQSLLLFIDIVDYLNEFRTQISNILGFHRGSVLIM